LHGEEDVRDAAGGGLVTLVADGREVRCRRRTRADGAAASRDVDGSTRLVDVDVADLPDEPRRGGRTVRQTAVVGPLDLRQGGRDRAVEEVDRVLAVELVPLTVVHRSAAGDVPERVAYEGRAFVGRPEDRYVREDKARAGQRRRIVVRAVGGIGPPHREVDVAAAVSAHTCSRIRIVAGEGVRLTAVGPVAQVRVGVQVVVPEVDAGRNAADRGDVEVPE